MAFEPDAAVATAAIESYVTVTLNNFHEHRAIFRQTTQRTTLNV